MAKKKKNNQANNKVSKNEVLLAVVIAVLLGFGGGFAIGSVANSDDDTQSTSVNKNDMTAHSHDSTFVVDLQEAPTVEVMVMEDAKSGYNVRIKTTNFRFAPENANGENVVGEGHAHLYVGGEKIGRVYGEWFHYNVNFEGTKEFRVTLNANDHSDYMVKGVGLVEDTVQVTHDSSDPDHAEMHDSSDHSN